MALLESLRDHGLDVRAGMSRDQCDETTTRLVVRPTSTEQVSDALRCASLHTAVVAVRGRGTKPAWGNPAPETDLLIDLSAMDRVLDHQPGDLIVQVQAGASLASVQDAVSTAGQRLLIDDLAQGSSIGGLVATNVSGPHRVVAGTVRDTLIGVTFVRADGTIAHAGGKVVKNVAGYDLCKLLTGSFGTLGVITEATFRLHPQPERAQWLTTEISADQLDAALRELNGSQLAPSAIEIDAPPGQPIRLAVLLEGTQAGVAARSRDMQELLAVSEQRQPDWAFTYPYEPADIGLKVTCQLSSVGDLVRTAHSQDVHLRGCAGAGVLFGRMHDHPGAAAALTALRSAADRAGGSVVIQHGARSARTELDVWGPVPGLPIMRRIKAEFDPHAILAPTRFVGGI